MHLTESLTGRRAAGRLAALAAAAGVAGALLLSIPAAGGLHRLDAALFDAQARLLRTLKNPQNDRFEPDVVIVGIDDASLAALDVPLGLMHDVLGAALAALADAGARLTAVDVVLPDRSFDHLRAGLDEALMRGLLAARRAGGVVFVLEPDPGGRLRPPFEPLLAAAGHGGGQPVLGVALFPIDADNVVRRFDPGLAATAADGTAVPTFVVAIARRLGRTDQLHKGWIDFTRGAPFTYVPLADVVRWRQQGDLARLRAQFAGRLVLIGGVMPYADRHPQPVDLVGWPAPPTDPPGVVLHAQALRSALGHGFIRAVPWPLAAALALGFAALSFVGRLGMRWFALAGAALAAFAGATLWHGAGSFVALAPALGAGLIAVAVRTSADVWLARRERTRLAQTFGGYVSPQLLQALLEGRVQSGPGRRAMAFMFADLRGFTAWSERAEPEQVLAVMNRYYGRITPIVHAHGGTIDNFRGDGIMVMFGAPEPHPDACGAAFAAARALVCATQDFVRGADAAQGAPLEVSIGLAWGDAVFGDLGSPDRKDFTALGDAVNVAARLQELAKSVGFPVLMTAALCERLPPQDGISAARAFGIETLGEAPLKNHSPVKIAGWRPPAPA